MRASTTTFSRMETFLISIFVIAGEQQTHIFALSFPFSNQYLYSIYLVNVINIFIGQVSPGLQERVQLSPCVQSMGDYLGCRQEIFLLYLSRGFYILYHRPDLFTAVLSLHSSEPSRDISGYYY